LLILCHLVNVSLQHGTSGGGAYAYGAFGVMLGPIFHRYREGYSFAKLACDLAGKQSVAAYRAKIHNAMALAAVWTQPIASFIDLHRAVFRIANETGDLTFACYSMFHSATGLLLRNDPLDAVWRETQLGLDFVRKAKFQDVVDIVVGQQRFVAAMQGRTATLSTFSDAQFDEGAFEAQLPGDRATSTICFYWILKLKARFISGDYAEALAAADKAKPLLWSVLGLIQLLDYFYYTALTVAACYENASADEQQKGRGLLSAHEEQLREWAENYPPTFADKHTLVSAEIARLEGRDADAMRLYEQAIQSARENGFVQNEGLAHELAARFYAALGVEKIADVYLLDARHCYLRWGALGKVRQLEERYPHLQEGASTTRAATIGAPVAQLDVEMAVKASQAVSGEIIPENLIKTLMVIAVEHAGAERGLLILPRGDQLWVEAEATTGRKIIEVNLRRAPVTPSELPLAILQYVIRTQELVISDDASREKPLSADEYVASRHVRSLLCLPLIKQTKLVGVLYLENNVAAAVFTPARLSLLKLLASQAAISLENSRLYHDLEEREAKIRRLVEANIIGVFVGDFDGRILEANGAFLRIVGYDPEDLAASRINWKDLTPRDWRERDARWIEEHKRTGSDCRLRRNTSGKTAAASPFCWARPRSKKEETNLSVSCSI
jgi:PAS domain S-box-containing protein